MPTRAAKRNSRSRVVRTAKTVKVAKAPKTAQSTRKPGRKPAPGLARKRAPAGTSDRGARPPLQEEVEAAVAWLRRKATQHTLEGMARYGLPSDQAFGVSVSDIQLLSKQLGRNHELAVALWDTGWYEARMLTAFIDEPERVTPAQMDRWCRDFDNWGICDTVCFHLFDRTPHAWAKVEEWSGRREEFVKRAAFALLASLALHDKRTGDAPFARCLPLVERAATDDRNFVKKGVSWALRLIGRRSPELNVAAVAVARRLSESPEAAARWVGKGALKEITSPAVTRRLAARRRGVEPRTK